MSARPSGNSLERGQHAGRADRAGPWGSVGGKAGRTEPCDVPHRGGRVGGTSRGRVPASAEKRQKHSAGGAACLLTDSPRAAREEDGSREAPGFSVEHIWQDEENQGGEQTWEGMAVKNSGVALQPELWGDSLLGICAISRGRCREVRTGHLEHSLSIEQGTFPGSSDIRKPFIQGKGYATFASQNQF